MSEKENILNESSEESSASTYSKDVTPILRKNAIDHSIITKVTEELKIERLRMEHAEMDAQIAAIKQRIALDEKEGEDLDRQLHNATELEKQAIRCFKRTGDMFTVLVEESDKLKNEFKNLESRQVQFSAKVAEVTAKEEKNQQLMRKIGNLEQQIKDVVNAPKPSLDKALIQDNIQLRLKFEQQLHQLATHKLKKSQKEELKEKKCRLLQEICIAQERNKELKERLGEKRRKSEENRAMLKGKFTDVQHKIFSNTTMRDQLLNDIKHTENAAKAITTKLIAKRSQQLHRVQEKRTELADSLAAKQAELVNQQLQQTEQQNHLENLQEKLETETRELEEWKTKKQALNEQLEQLKKQLTNLSLSFKERLAKAGANFNEKKELLLTQHGLETANIELLELQRDEKLQKIEEVKKELKKLETLIKWERMQFQFEQNKAAKLGMDISALLDTKNVITSYQTKASTEETELIEMEDTLTSGQKSPGILKSPHRNIQQQPDKHVTFEGLSSTESSASCVALPGGGGTDSELNEDAFNQLISDWATNAAGLNNRRNLDF